MSIELAPVLSVAVGGGAAAAVVDVRRRGASRMRPSRQVDLSKIRLERKKLPLYDVAATNWALLRLPVAEEKHLRDWRRVVRRRDGSSEGRARVIRGARMSTQS